MLSTEIRPNSNSKFISISIVIFFISCIIPPILASAHSEETNDNGPNLTKVNNEKITCSSFRLASSIDDAGNIYVLWQDVIGDGNHNTNIYVSTSTDGGKSFSGKVRVNDIEGSANDINLFSMKAYGNGNVCVVWEDNRPQNGQTDIYCDFSTDHGKNFGQDIRVVDEFVKSNRDPYVNVDDRNNIYMVWKDSRSENSDIYFAKLPNCSLNFTENIQVNEDTTGYNPNSPAVEISDEGIIYVVWMDKVDYKPDYYREVIHFSRSVDGGDTFHKPEIISDYRPDPDFIDITVYKKNIYVIWYEYTDSAINFVSSKDKGKK